MRIRIPMLPPEISVWSTEFLESRDSSECFAILEMPLWNKVHSWMDGSQRIFLNLTYGESTWICGVGSPIQTPGDMSPLAEGDPPRVYLPPWIVARLGIDGVGETVATEWLDQDAFPEATRIVLRPHDSAFYHGDAKEELERALTRMGVLRKGDSILIPLQELGGYEVECDVILTEPGSIVLLQGDEVVMEFEESLDTAGVPLSPAPVQTPSSSGSAEGLFDDFHSFLDRGPPGSTPHPNASYFQGLGNVLGGTPGGPRINPWKNPNFRPPTST